MNDRRPWCERYSHLALHRLHRTPQRALGLAVLVLAIALGASAVHAKDEAVDEQSWGYALAHELMSPFCPGRTLAACTSGQAAELRQWILFQEAAGATREETLEALYKRWGDVLRSSPVPKGWGLAAHLLPGAALVLGAGVVLLAFRHIVAPTRSGAAPAEASTQAVTSENPERDAELERQLDDELRASDV